MFNPGLSITLAPINTTSIPGGPTSTTVLNQNSTGIPTSTSVIDTTSSTGDLISSVTASSISTSTPIASPTSTFLSSTIIPSLSSTSDFLPSTDTLPSHYSISVVSLTLFSTDDLTITPTSTAAGSQTTITISVVETAALSSDTPQHTGLSHQTGAVIGIAIGGTFLFLLLMLLLFFACRHHSNGSHSSSMEDIFAVSRNGSWRSPLEADDDEDYLTPYGRPVSPNYSRSQGHDDGRFIADHLSVEGSGSAESAEANGASLMKPAFGGQPPLPPVIQSLHDPKNPRDPSMSPNYPFHDALRPWWLNTEPLNINKRNGSQRPPLSVDSHVSARSTGSSGLGGGSSSNEHRSLGSSGEALLPGDTKRRFPITEPRPVHKLSGRRHHFTPPSSAFVLARDSSLEYATQRIQQHQEEQKQQDRVDQSISQIILGRLRRTSNATTVKSHSQCTTTKSEESGSSRAPSYTYSPSLLNPPMVVSGLYPQGVTGLGNSSHTPDNMIQQHLPRHQGADEKPLWPSVTLPPISPVPSTDTLSMVEGLLHPRLGMALAHSQQASFTSLRDHEDYTRPINGLVNNHIQSTTTFDTADLGEGGNTT